MTIRLPSEPKDKDYEDFVTSCMLTLGYFVETNLTLKEGKAEVAELDIVATPVDDPVHGAILIEAKSGKSRFSDVFKTAGLKEYLGIPNGVVVGAEPPDEIKRDAIEMVSKVTGVRVATVHPRKELPSEALARTVVELDDDTRIALLSATWFGRIARRRAMEAFGSYCKGNPGIEAVENARKYRWAIERSFFAERPLERAHLLYDAYKASPNITGALVTHLTGAEKDKAKAEWTKIRDTAERGALQRALVMEHSARIRIIKNALLHTRIKDEPAKGKVVDWSELLMPNSFLRGLEELREQPYADRVPFLFQVFVECFGGFYALHDDRDIKAMSDCTGIPVDQIEDSLMLFNKFFPLNGGWFFAPKNEIRCMKMIPAILRGTGAFLRARLFDAKNYNALFPQMGWLVSNWHNALYAFLEPALHVAK